ncbi:MAG: aminotransferase class III-fold pyridoxal phosphate-dependent enzyme [Pirellulaceae bacterium]|nr:aminotransferase class III-fold pyridoxal phosphate-dependent enzyme [Pirellulaceae bacterium]
MSTVTSTPDLQAQCLRQDPRIAAAKSLILQAVEEHQRPLASVRPPRPELEAESKALLDAFGTLRGGALFYPYLSSGLGNGPFVELIDGSVKLDFITGIGVHGYGHSHPDVVAAGIDAAISDTVMQGNLQQDVASLEFCKLLVSLARESGAALEHCFISSSGAMANENALKMAFQKNHPADRTIAFEHCFAGRTLVLSQLTDKAAYRQGLPPTLEVDYLPFFDEADPAGSTDRAVARLKEHLHRYPGRHANLWLEMIQGEGGYHVGDRNFFRALCEVAREHGLAVIVDEVQSFGRTTRPFAFQHFGLDDLVDIVTVGKISQACATLFTPAYQPKPGLISQTFTGSTWSIIAGKAIVEGLVNNGNFGPHGKNVQLHERFAAGLAEIAERRPGTIQGPYGLGGMVVFTAFDGSAEKAKDLTLRFFHAGLMSFMAGANPTRIRFLMPLACTTFDHIDLACQIIDQCIADVAEAE